MCVYVSSPQAVFEQVEFKQANLSSTASCERVFADDDGPFDIVYNLAAETKYGQSDEVGRQDACLQWNSQPVAMVTFVGLPWSGGSQCGMSLALIVGLA